jgi:hypothetical protein
MNKLRFDGPPPGAYLTGMTTRGLFWFFGLGMLLVAAACAEGTPSARSANDEDEASDSNANKSHDDSDWYDSGSTDKAGGEKKANKDNGSSPPEPSFKQGMSVNDAINAIPQGYPRVDIDQEDLDRPLMDPGFYKTCKLTPAQHFEIKFAVWEGRAVGLDIKTTPNNKNLEQCLHGLFTTYTWKDKVKSLNISTVTF